jgi:3-oxoadipate enol-lactonase
MTDGLLLLHAFPLDASMWDPQIESLNLEGPVVAPNFPGFGEVPLTDAVLRMDAAADAAAERLSEQRVDRAVVCGLSMGGYVAFALWRRHRDRVLGLVLSNTRAGRDDEAGRQRRIGLAERLRAEGNAFLAESPPPLLSSDAPVDLWDRVKAIVRKQPAEAIAAASLGMAERADSTGDLPGIDVPTLVLTSSEDTLIPPEASRLMAEQIPAARFALIERAGHLSNMEAPEAFNRLLRDHVARCGLRAT